MMTELQKKIQYRMETLNRSLGNIIKFKYEEIWEDI